MKKLIVLAFALASFAVSAAEVVVLETEIPATMFRTLVDTRFYMDQTTMEGFAKVAVSEERYMQDPYPRCNYDQYGRCIPAPSFPTPVQVPVYSNSVKIDGLMLMGDKVIYHGAEGNVDCGTMGLSRVFKIPTLYLSGNCSLEGRLSSQNHRTVLKVVLKTK